MKKRTGVAIAALALALGTAGCRTNQGDTTGEQTGGGGTMDTGEAGATRVEDGERAGSDNLQNRSGATQGQMQAFRVERVEGEQVTLVPQSATAGERDPQAGSEISIEKSEFRTLAGFEAKQGDMVHVQLGQDGKPTKIEKHGVQSGQQDPQAVPQGNPDYQQQPQQGP